MSFNMNLNKGAAGSSVGPTQTGNVIPKGFRQGQMNQFTPQQHQLFSSLFGNVGQDSYLSKLAGGDPQAFQEMEAPALRQFQEMQGNTASRFAGMGTGALKSSGFKNTMNQASQDFASQLHSQRMDYRNQALRDLMEMSNQLLGQRPYEQFMVQNSPKNPGFLKQIGMGLAGGLGQGLGVLGSGYGMKKFF